MWKWCWIYLGVAHCRRPEHNHFNDSETRSLPLRYNKKVPNCARLLSDVLQSCRCGQQKQRSITSAFPHSNSIAATSKQHNVVLQHSNSTQAASQHSSSTPTQQQRCIITVTARAAASPQPSIAVAAPPAAWQFCSDLRAAASQHRSGIAAASQQHRSRSC